MTSIYFDASALVKLGVDEPETEALRAALPRAAKAYTSVIGRIEFERAIRRSPVEDPDTMIEPVLQSVEVISMNAAIAAYASVVRPPALRSLDAIHLATMLSIREDLDVAYLYDERLAAAAVGYGIPVRAPR